MTGSPAEPDTPEADPRDTELAEARQQLADAGARIAELTDQVIKLTQTVNQRTIERDAHAADLEKTQVRLAATHHADHALADRGRREGDPHPTSDRALYLRAEARADALALRLAAAEAELHDVRYPRVRQAASA